MLHRRRHVAAGSVQLVALYSEVKPLEPSLGVEGVDGAPMHTWHAQPWPSARLSLERSGSIYVQWKQWWCTDEAWGKRLLLVPAEQISALVVLSALLASAWLSHQEASPYWNLLIVSKCGVRPSLSASTRSYRMNSCGCVRLSSTTCLGSKAREHRWTLSWQT